MKLYIRYKGGSGSGNFNHEGRPGKVGGSSDTAKIDLPKSTRKAGDMIAAAILADPEMRNMAAGLAADGSIDDVQNVIELINDYVPDYSNTIDPEKTHKTFNAMHADYESATAIDSGWDISGKSAKNATRKAFENKYYGKTVGGFNEGESYAKEQLGNFIESKFNVKKPEPVKSRDWEVPDSVLSDKSVGLKKTNLGLELDGKKVYYHGVTGMSTHIFSPKKTFDIFESTKGVTWITVNPDGSTTVERE